MDSEAGASLGQARIRLRPTPDRIRLNRLRQSISAIPAPVAMNESSVTRRAGTRPDARARGMRRVRGPRRPTATAVGRPAPLRSAERASIRLTTPTAVIGCKHGSQEDRVHEVGFRTPARPGRKYEARRVLEGFYAAGRGISILRPQTHLRPRRAASATTASLPP
jgi:hypothetical protein